MIINGVCWGRAARLGTTAPLALQVATRGHWRPQHPWTACQLSLCGRMTAQALQPRIRTCLLTAAARAQELQRQQGMQGGGLSQWS